jgi:aspartyl protease family protein
MSTEDEIREQKRMGTAMQALAWLVLLALGVAFFSDFLEDQYNPNQSHASYSEGGAREVVLQRNKFGHYVTAGQINGKPVAIPEDLSDSLGLQPGPAFPTQTANGVGVGYAVTLDSVSVGAIELHDVSASITPGLQTQEILLGMSFLKHIEFTQRDDTLILRQ